MPSFNFSDFKTGGLRLDRGGSGIIQGPGQGYAGPQDVYNPQRQKKQIQGDVLGVSTSNDLAGLDTLQQDINRSVDDLGSIIDRDFESALAQLGTQEQNLRSSAGVAEQGVRAQAQQSRTALQNQQQASLAGIGKEEQQAQTTSNSALREARDLNRQIQQQNIAQLSSLGISSSSVAEALAERLGVETARRIGGITGSRDEILQNLQAERTRINEVATQKLADLEQSVGVQISQIQNNLMAGLNQINTARDTAARDKANRRAELLSSAQTQIANLKAQAQQFQQQLQQAAARRQASVNESLNLLTASPQDFGNLISNVNALAPSLQSAGLQFSNVNPNGSFSLGPARIDKTQDQEEDENLF